MPNRIIKESICSSDSIDGLTWLQEVFFYRLIVTVDDYGRFDARPAILRARMFPLKNVTDKQVSEALDALSSAGIVSTYTVEDKPYLQIVTWERHQQIRSKKSKYPAPEEADNLTDDIKRNQMISDDIRCPRNPIQSESNPNPNPNPNPDARTREDVDEERKSLNDQRFARFWEKYPKKVGKKAAKRAWDAVRPDGTLFDSILSALEDQMRSDQWKRDNGQYIPNPATWINQGRWDDDVSTYSRGAPQRQYSGRRDNVGNFQQRQYESGQLSGMMISRNNLASLGSAVAGGEEDEDS